MQVQQVTQGGIYMIYKKYSTVSNEWRVTISLVEGTCSVVDLDSDCGLWFLFDLFGPWTWIRIVIFKMLSSDCDF